MQSRKTIFGDALLSIVLFTDLFSVLLLNNFGKVIFRLVVIIWLFRNFQPLDNILVNADLQISFRTWNKPSSWVLICKMAVNIDLPKRPRFFRDICSVARSYGKWNQAEYVHNLRSLSWFHDKLPDYNSNKIPISFRGITLQFQL